MSCYVREQPCSADILNLRDVRLGTVAYVAWATPQFSKTRVDEAGRALVHGAASKAERSDALLIINNWRSSHSFPLNTMQMGLRRNADLVCDEPLVAQRLKRLPWIEAKLRLQRWRLTQIQDIGGARVVLGSVAEVYRLEARYRASEIRHELVADDDYVLSPRSSGYRSLHLVYRYSSDRNETYNASGSSFRFGRSSSTLGPPL